MEPLLSVVSVVLIVVMLGFLAWLVAANFASRREIAGQSGTIASLQQQLDSLKGAQDGTREALQQSLHSGQTSISRTLESSQQVLTELHSQIGRLRGTSEQMLEISAGLRRLQQILSSPKLRGQMGESSLENLLAGILPADSYGLQYSFRDGQRIDAIVHLADHSVPIDAKFPLPAFEAMVRSQDQQSRTQLRKQFLRDLTVHIDKIASSYIRPDEGTLDFALMYIPAENIYYETVVKYPGEDADVLGHALEKKVIPVSPNLLYAYLMTVAMGLHGLRIETRAAEILKSLTKLRASFGDFNSSWEVLGTHLRNAYGKYEEGQRRLDRFDVQLDQIQACSPDAVVSGAAAERAKE
jgi:DNA recombination protein RmuC